jgi:hypothetical protein
MHKRSRHVGSGGLGAISLTHPLFRGGWAGTAGEILLGRLEVADLGPPVSPGGVVEEN